MRDVIALVMSGAVLLGAPSMSDGQSSANITAVAVVGDVTPVGGTVARFDDRPSINDAGDVLFNASISGGRAERGIFLASRGVVAKVVAAGDPTPAGGTFNTFSVGYPLTTRSRAAVFSAHISGGKPSVGVFLAAGGSVTKIAATGDAAPTGGTFVTFFGRPSVNEGETVAFGGNIEGGAASWGIFLASKGRIIKVVADGEPTPLGGTFSRHVTWPVINAQGAVAFGAAVRGSPVSQGVFLAAEGKVIAVAQDGAVAPGTGQARFLQFKDPDLGDRGEVAFRADLLGGAAEQGLFVATRQGLIKLAVSGDALGGLRSFGHPVGRARANSSGSIFFKARVHHERGGIGYDGIYVASQGTITNIVREGSATPVGGTFVNLSAPFPNNSGTSVFKASVAGGRSAEGIFVAKLP